MEEKFCNKRINMNDISLYANCNINNRMSVSNDDHRDTYLLSQTDTRTRVERQEYEGVWGEVFAKTIVKESIRVEF